LATSRHTVMLILKIEQKREQREEKCVFPGTLL